MARIGLSAVIVLAILSIFTNVADAQWHVKRVPGIGDEARCILETDQQFGFDGYQDIEVHVLVNAAFVVVKTESALDESFNDIGLQIDDKDLIKMDRVGAKKSAIFEKNYAALVEALKNGTNLRAQLRYWPTWPATGTHDVKFSLFGFGKMYDEMLACH